MRRGILCVLLVSGCFAEAPEPIDKIGTTMTTTAPAEEESSSSSDGESSGEAGSSGEESSSAGETSPFDPCPEWCHNGCDLVQGVYTMCRCFNDLSCEDGTRCEGAMPEPPNPVNGYCM